jgi:methyl-accepting chemotaxis protein
VRADADEGDIRLWEGQMNGLETMKTRTRLMVAFGVVVVLAAVLGIGGLVALSKVQGSVDDIADNWLPSVRAASDMERALSTFRRRQMNHVLASDEGQMKQYEQELRAMEPEVEAKIASYEKLIALPEERQIVDRIRAGWRDYLRDSAEATARSAGGQKAEARTALMGDSRRRFDAIGADLDRLIAVNGKGADQAREHSDAVYASARNITIGLLLVVSVVGATLATLITRSLMRDLGGEPAYAREMLRRVAAGELGVRIDVEGSDERSLMAELRKMVASLNGIVTSIRSASDSISTASTQIAAGNVDLSARTEEQASNLQQTAASMEQFTGSVTANAASARQAAELASGAAEVAGRSGTLVGEVVQTMAQIQESSRRITDIISVIDGIAVQTNILALNAAVEAARAGEQGRGFAVVAGEVRSLAQRASQAAREIKTLINDSSEKVETGGRQVQSAGGTIEELVAQVQRVSALISEITAATLEQSAGINQVNNAVTQLDQVTQQNAALVEESAAATESLKAQAQGLSQAVSVFRTAAPA